MTLNKQQLPVRRTALIFISTLLLAFIFRPVLTNGAYSEPTSSPPQYDTVQIPEVINVGGSATIYQQKAGSLLIGPRDASTCDLSSGGVKTGCAKLCLNPDTTTYPGSSDPANCIQAWSDLTPPSGSFLKKFNGTSTDPTILPPLFNPGGSSGATRDSGYVAWQAKPSGTSYDATQAGQSFNNTSQLFSLIAETPSGTENLSANTYPAAAIRTEGFSNAYYAAQFLGTLSVVGSGGSAPRLCLNDQGGSGSCITKWSDLIGLTNAIVSLQNLSASQHILDQGQTSTTGSLVVGALVAGEPTITTPISYTCGDAICQSQTESHATCAADCKL